MPSLRDPLRSTSSCGCELPSEAAQSCTAHSSSSSDRADIRIPTTQSWPGRRGSKPERDGGERREQRPEGAAAEAERWDCSTSRSVPSPCARSDFPFLFSPFFSLSLHWFCSQAQDWIRRDAGTGSCAFPGTQGHPPPASVDAKDRYHLSPPYIPATLGTHVGAPRPDGVCCKGWEHPGIEWPLAGQFATAPTTHLSKISDLIPFSSILPLQCSFSSQSCPKPPHHAGMAPRVPCHHRQHRRVAFPTYSGEQMWFFPCGKLEWALSTEDMSVEGLRPPTTSTTALLEAICGTLPHRQLCSPSHTDTGWPPPIIPSLGKGCLACPSQRYF